MRLAVSITQAQHNSQIPSLHPKNTDVILQGVSKKFRKVIIVHMPKRIDGESPKRKMC